MDVDWQEALELFSSNNTKATSQKHAGAVAFLDTIGYPAMDEIEALEENKANSMSWPTPTIMGIPAHDPHESLLHEYKPDASTTLPLRTCSNIHLYDFNPDNVETSLRYRELEPPEWAAQHSKEYAWTQGNVDFLDVVQLFCESTNLVICRWPRCQAHKAKLDQAIPACKSWPNFRQWALSAASCQLTAAGAGYQFHDIFSFYQIENLFRLKKSSGFIGNAQRMFEVCQVAFMLLREVQSRCTIIKNGYLSYKNNNPLLWAWNSGEIPRCLTIPAVRQATIDAKTLHICTNRLWNLAYSSERGHDDLPALIELASQCHNSDSLAHKGHGQCSAAFCLFSDENSTLKKQLHKCTDNKCYKVTLPLEQLNTAVRLDQPAAWPIKNIASSAYTGLSPSTRDVMAISHVWSDGTGVGVGNQGEVNCCLIFYFANIASQLGCDGIWWDSICIPTERQARRKAVSRMHENYASAKHTIIHDRYLLQFDWADDGSPALALVLSPWFTRGWTALELSVSKSVKVIYRDPTNHSQQVIKDLDRDILSSGPFCKLGHIVASALISRLRKNEPGISDLLLTLRTRTTSWARDRLAIAAMLSRAEDYDYEDSPAMTTRKIISMYREVPLGFLLHGHDTINSGTGGFSWCPSNILHASPSSSYSLKHRFLEGDTALIDEHGAAIAMWHYRALTSDDRGALLPHSQHLSVDFRLREVLEKSWRYCLLLQCDVEGPNPPPALLVTTAGLSWPNELHAIPTSTQPCLDAHYIGCVLDTVVARTDYSRFSVAVRIGCDVSRPNIPAAKVLKWSRSYTLQQFNVKTLAFRKSETTTLREKNRSRRRFDTTVERGYGGIGMVGSGGRRITPHFQTHLHHLRKLWLFWPRGLRSPVDQRIPSYHIEASERTLQYSAFYSSESAWERLTGLSGRGFAY